MEGRVKNVAKPFFFGINIIREEQNAVIRLSKIEVSFNWVSKTEVKLWKFETSNCGSLKPSY